MYSKTKYNSHSTNSNEINNGTKKKKRTMSKNSLSLYVFSTLSVGTGHSPVIGELTIRSNFVYRLLEQLPLIIFRPYFIEILGL